LINSLNFILINFVCRPRTRGIYGAFINDDEGEQMAVEAEIHAEEISNAFNNKRKGKQNFTKARINRYCIKKKKKKKKNLVI